MKELYDKMIQAYKSGDENLFAAAARNFVEAGENPFEGPAKDLYASAEMHCRTWRNKSINGRVSKLKMIECIRKIAEMDLPSPYNKPTHVDGFPQIEKTAKITKAEEALVYANSAEEFDKALNEPQHILGVLPYEVQVTETPEEEVVEEPAEQQADAKTEKAEEPAPKKLFGRHKKR